MKNQKLQKVILIFLSLQIIPGITLTAFAVKELFHKIKHSESEITFLPDSHTDFILSINGMNIPDSMVMVIIPILGTLLLAAGIVSFIKVKKYL